MKHRITTLFLCCSLLCLAVGCGNATENSTAETVNAVIEVEAESQATAESTSTSAVITTAVTQSTTAQTSASSSLESASLTSAATTPAIITQMPSHTEASGYQTTNSLESEVILTTPAVTSTKETTVTTTITKTETTTASTTQASTTVQQSASVSAPYAGLYRADSLECIYENSADSYIHPASMTKVLTACTALHYISPDTVYTVGSEQNLVPKGSSLCLIKAGHRLKLRDLLTGMLMCSGNDAAYAVAVNVARDVSGDWSMSDADAVAYFVQLLNDYAIQLGASNSYFVTPDGWDHAQQHTTIYDLAKISAHAMQLEEIRNIASSRSKYVVFASGENITWTNTNSLLHPDSSYYLPDAIGLKTGTTPLAGNCLIAVINRNGTDYIAIVAGCQSNTGRYEVIHELVNML
ncbi:MAG: D-alanyl-D-alanine carboxypeptidase [Ruminococcus sp.]|nr:D-alanyl-D-alanine carboxypeptidase [Ruminococcus sp.]